MLLGKNVVVARSHHRHHQGGLPRLISFNYCFPLFIFWRGTRLFDIQIHNLPFHVCSFGSDNGSQTHFWQLLTSSVKYLRNLFQPYKKEVVSYLDASVK